MSSKESLAHPRFAEALRTLGLEVTPVDVREQK
jgi:hypothetical protein